MQPRRARPAANRVELVPVAAHVGGCRPPVSERGATPSPSLAVVTSVKPRGRVRGEATGGIATRTHHGERDTRIGRLAADARRRSNKDQSPDPHTGVPSELLGKGAS